MRPSPDIRIQTAADALLERIRAAALDIAADHGVQVSLHRMATEDGPFGVYVEATLSVTEPGDFMRGPK